MVYAGDTSPARGTRSWTDDQLATAVRDARSWRQVLRNLGLYPGGPNHVVKREAARLGLDTSHFGVGLRCSDDELMAVLASATTWTQVLTALKLRPGSRRCREAVEAKAAQLGLATDQIGVAARRRRAIPAEWLSLDPDLDHLRNAAEPLSTAWFLLRDLWPAVPAEPRPYDLLLETPAGLRRVQVKTTTYRDRRGSWLVRVGHRPDGSPTRADFVPYDADEVDLFFIVDGDLLLYLIPREVIEGKTSLCLRDYTSFIVGDASSLLDSRSPAGPSTSRPATAA